MSGPKVYADLTFLINFIMDFTILWATGRFVGIKIIYYRIVIASLLGGVYAVGYIIPGMHNLYSLPMKIIFSCLLIILALQPANWDEFKKSFLLFYGFGFLAAGATLASSYFLPSSLLHSATYSHIWLLGGILAVVLAAVYGGKYLTGRIIPGLLKFNVELRFDNTTCTGKGFLDTGNGLRDPLTDRPVVVAEYNLLKDSLPDDVQHAIEDCSDETRILESVSRSSWANRVRIIPFSSIGKRNGILIGLRADELIVDNGKKSILHKNLVIGVYREQLSCDGSYHLLIPSEILLES
ncbi:MAG: sigma-E processing peptidase SpoIIGA [Syntrophomonadaceae bacterium]|nr:sigma-E processing peptidase SpoIIGA [Syntrophomonadaceae bacterium]MDD3888820.1 sigma-E processing peptidase SpoIIGA [Syntrophomonadaceae bacterium]MDD4548205.1 sigma-E processing peptidase SpoIIGA [Syntrophomonadaceae bacterium]